MHFLDFLNRSVAIGPVIVHSEVVGGAAGDLAHEVRNPSVTGVVASAGRADELVASLSEMHNLVVPGGCRLLRGDAVALRLVEEVDDAVLRRLDGCPVVSREICGAVDHGSEGCAAFELGWCPGIPVAD